MSRFFRQKSAELVKKGNLESGLKTKMAEIQQLVLDSLKVVGPFLIGGAAEGIASEAGKEVWAFMKSIFRSEREKKLLIELENSPNNTLSQGKVAGKFEELLESDSKLIEQLELLLNKVPVVKKTNSQAITGNNNIGLQDINNSKLTINNPNVH